MPKDITFNEVCKFLMKDDGSLIDATGHLLGAALVCSPLVFGPVALPALGLLGAKKQLIDLGKTLFSKITSKKDTDYLARTKRMEMAYGLICYTAFFDALDRILPDDLRKKIELQSKEKGQKLKEDEIDEMFEKMKGPLNDSLSFPHPTSSLEELKSNLSKLYLHMANGFGEYVEKLSIYKKEDEKIFNILRQIIDKLPEEAMSQFEDQYYELARKYEDFRIWIDIKEKRADHETRSKYMKEFKLLAQHSDEKMDIGFNKLQKTVHAMPDIFREIRAKNVVEALKNRYDHIIKQPIIDEKDIPEDDRTGLFFPKISEAFIPQSYRILRHTSKNKDIHLEKEETWDNLDRKNNLEAFLLKFLSSPYSIEAPLLILGHPGSGKSLLTKVLSARLMSDTYTPIRIPLRDSEHPGELKVSGTFFRGKQAYPG